MGASADAVAFRQALDDRLRELAGEDEVWLTRDRRTIAFSQMLARLNASAPGCWSLAGGFAIDCRSLRPRTAQALDIEWRIDRAAGYLDAEFDALAHDMDDFFEFGIRVAGSGVSGYDGAHRRLKVRISIAGEPFDAFEIKFRLRFGEVGTEKLQPENLLAFAGVAPIEVDAMALEVLLADQLLEYTRSVEYELGDSAARGLIDLKLIAELPAINARTLALSIAALFDSHDEPLPESLPYPFEESTEPYERIATSMGAPTELDDGFDEVTAFLDPVLGTEVLEGTWDPAERLWI